VEPHRGAGYRRYAGWGCAGLAALALSVPLRADDPPQGNSQVTSNQSVSVEEAPDTASAVGGEDAGSAGNADVAANAVGAPSAAPLRLSPSGVTIPHTARDAGERPVSEEGESSASGRVRPGRAAAWYQSGPVALAIVLGVVGGGYVLLRRFVPGTRARDGGVMQVVARVTLTPRHSVVLVRLPRRLMLVGLAPDRVNALASIEEPEEVAELLSRLQVPAGLRAGQFDELLEDEADRHARVLGAQGVGPRESGGADALSGLLGKLHTLTSRSRERTRGH